MPKLHVPASAFEIRTRVEGDLCFGSVWQDGEQLIETRGYSYKGEALYEAKRLRDNIRERIKLDMKRARAQSDAVKKDIRRTFK